MPILSMVYGNLIRMFLLDNKHHNLPHIHAKFAEFEASISIGDGETLAGDLLRKQLRLARDAYKPANRCGQNCTVAK